MVMSTYRRFAELMEDREFLHKQNVTFNNVCRQLSVSPSSLDEIIEKELGMSGREVIDYYRKIE